MCMCIFGFVLCLSLNWSSYCVHTRARKIRERWRKKNNKIICQSPPLARSFSFYMVWQLSCCMALIRAYFAWAIHFALRFIWAVNLHIKWTQNEKSQQRRLSENSRLGNTVHSRNDIDSSMSLPVHLQRYLNGVFFFLFVKDRLWHGQMPRCNLNSSYQSFARMSWARTLFHWVQVYFDTCSQTLLCEEESVIPFLPVISYFAIFLCEKLIRKRKSGTKFVAALYYLFESFLLPLLLLLTSPLSSSLLGWSLYLLHFSWFCLILFNLDFDWKWNWKWEQAALAQQQFNWWAFSNGINRIIRMTDVVLCELTPIWIVCTHVLIAAMHNAMFIYLLGVIHKTFC